MLKQVLLLLLAATAFSQSGSMQITPSNPLLNAQSNYIGNYFPFFNMPSTSTFTLNFNATYIKIPSGPINVSAVLNNVAITGATASCSNSVCTLKLNKNIASGTPIQFTLGFFTNPYFLRNQTITTTIVYNSSYTQNQLVTVSTDQYTLMAITSNSLAQSDYGVGNPNVNYIFNFTLPLSPSNVQLSVTIPPQVSIGNQQISLVYYGTVMYVTPIFASNIIVMSFNATANNNPGIVLLNISGLVNPQSMGNSSSFVIQLLIPTLPGSTSSCSNCAVAQLNNNLFAQSTVPGNIQTININLVSPTINQQSNLTIYSKLYAPIPTGGMYRITLPRSVKPALPIYCQNKYGFTIINGATPSCSYDSSSNTIYTNNFVFLGSGSVLILIVIINPPDTTPANLYFQTLDANLNIIGKSTTPAVFSASPLPLTASVLKTNSQVQTSYNMAINLTLGIPLTSTNTIQVILPQATYNISSIACSAGTNIPCTAAVDSISSNLTITLSPPCTQCNVGSNLQFSISGLNNPSYISTYSQTIIVQSTAGTGVIETTSLSVTLTPATLLITNYGRNGDNTVGSSYSMVFSYSTSSFINANGGILLINFNQYDTYINPTGNPYVYPSALTITDAQNNQYTNSITYYTTSNPNSVQQIAINICGTNGINGNNCLGSIVITGLRKGFHSISGITQNIQITDVFSNSVSTSTFSINQYSPVKLANSLKLSLSKSVTTLSSSYVVDFVSPYLPFQSGLIFSLSGFHAINGGCQISHNSSILSGNFICQTLNSTSVTITYDGDITLMMLDIVDYTLTIVNVVNPPSIIPITYSLAAYFLNTVNQQYSIIYSIATPLPLTFLYVKSNNTFGQAAQLNITVASNYPNFSEIKMNIPSGLLTVLSSSTSNYQFSMANNIYQVSQIYSFLNQTVTLNIINPNSTATTGNITYSMFIGGYLSATGIISVLGVGPMYLGVSAVSSSRVVGDACNLTVSLSRVNNYFSESQYFISFSQGLFDYSAAKYNNEPVTMPLAVPIGLNTITITNLKNILWIPSSTPANSFTAWTVDNANNNVSVSAYTPTLLLPNTAATGISCAFTRTNTAINGIGSININYTPRFPTSTGIMNVYMPQNQNTIVSSNCSMVGASNNANNCTVLSSNSTFISVMYFNQSLTSLMNILNVEPNSNIMVVSMLTANNQLVQSMSGSITPTIQFNQLAIAGNITSTIVATNNQLFLNITSPSPIDIGSKIVINFPSNTFSRVTALVTQDCNYTINGVAFNGCQYGMKGYWLSQANLTLFGSNQLPANSNILISLYTTNAWVVSSFAAIGLDIFISNPTDNFVSQGFISLANIYGGIPNLVSSSISNATLAQTSSQANANNTITLSFSLPVALVWGATILINLPRNSYILSSTNLAAITNLVSNSSNSTYYTLSVSTTCSQASPVCNFANYFYSLTFGIQNNPYMTIQTNQLSLQMMSGSSVISQQLNLNIPSLIPQTFPTASAISRSNINAFALTNLTVFVSNPSSISSFTLVISPLVKNTAILPILIAPTSALLSSSQSLSYQLNSTNYLIVNVSSASGTSSNITISGQNNLLVSVSPQVYTVTLLDSNYVYFTAQITTSDDLIPYSLGMNLQRIVTTVGLATNIYLNGNLPTSIPSLSVAFNGNTYSISGNNFNISLGSITNNKNASDSSTYPIAIKNNDYIAYNSNLGISPSLTTQNLTSFIGFNMPSTVNITSNFNLNVNLNQTLLTYLSIKTPSFYKSLSGCCIDSTCSQNFIQSCTYSQQSAYSLIQLWLTSAQAVGNITFKVVSLDYQSSFAEQTISITSSLPTALISVQRSLTITALNITSTLLLKNWKVNELNTYTLNIQPIAKSGYLSITLPTFIASQIGNASNLALTLNGTAASANLVSQNGLATITVPVTFSTTNVSLLISNIINPLDNAPYTITLVQASDQNFNNIYGYSNLGIVMGEFDSITILSAIRLVTKVNTLSDLIIQATTPYSSDSFILVLPSSQMVTTNTCTVVANQTQTLNCQVLNSSSIMMSCLSGTNRYTISGLQNQKFYDPKTTGDLLISQIGAPYMRATTFPSRSSAISPRLTLGSIIMNSFTSSTSNLLSSATITYNITIQNTNNINGFIISYGNYYYIISPNVACTINSLKVPCNAIDNQTLFLNYPNPTTNALIVTVKSIYNFIKPANWTMKSVQTQTNYNITTYSDVDLYYNDGAGLGALQPSAMNIRVIIPKNYVQSSTTTFLVIIDNKYDDFLPLNNFRLNFTTKNNICTLLRSAFISSLAVSCVFSSSEKYDMDIKMYHSEFPNTPLSLGMSSMFIYPSPSNNCNNQMCDSCSVANGQQYCFSCREGLYSSFGQCVNDCDYGYFPYSNSKTCQPCSPTCSSCFDLYSDNCLSCRNTSLILSSGNCVNNCPLGTFSYNNFCVGSQECNIAKGCRLCSNTGFCYQCLPDYKGAPICQYYNAMPPTIMIYILAPFAILAAASIIYGAAKCIGAESLLSQTIFSLSFLELFSWALTIPIMSSVPTAMVLLSFFTLRIIISIVSYEVFYKKNLGELSQKLLEEESQKQIEGSEKKEQKQDKSDLDNWKTRLVRFLAHFNGPDSYELLKSKISEPVLSVNHSFAIQIIFMINRWLVCFVMFYMVSIATIGDSIMMPLVVIVNSVIVSICRLLTWQKARRCLVCFRN